MASPPPVSHTDPPPSHKFACPPQQYSLFWFAWAAVLIYNTVNIGASTLGEILLASPPSSTLGLHSLSPSCSRRNKKWVFLTHVGQHHLWLTRLLNYYYFKGCCYMFNSYWVQFHASEYCSEVNLKGVQWAIQPVRGSYTLCQMFGKRLVRTALQC